MYDNDNTKDRRKQKYAAVSAILLFEDRMYKNKFEKEKVQPIS